MLEKLLDLKSGAIIYNDFQLDSDKLLQDQIFLLKEDLFQISFDQNKYIIDVGWYPEFSLEGHFKTVVIKNYKWDEPLYIKESKNVEQVIKDIQDCINNINSEIHYCNV